MCKKYEICAEQCYDCILCGLYFMFKSDLDIFSSDEGFIDL